MTPSLHNSLQVSIEVGVPPEQCQPLTSPDHVASQPEVPSVPPSSQASPTTRRPSPQIGVQTVAPDPLSNPVAQVEHEVAPFMLENSPGLQGSQLVCPTLVAVPAKHWVQEVAPAELTSPIKHW